MRAVVQRVTEARVEVAGEVVGAIARGLVAFVGAEKGDGEADVDYLAQKLVGLRVFPDEAGKMSRALGEIGGALLLVSQFTVVGDLRRGRRPSFDGALAPGEATLLLDRFAERVRAAGLPVATGRFGADMRVLVDNDGPVTLLLDSRKVF